MLPVRDTLLDLLVLISYRIIPTVLSYFFLYYILRIKTIRFCASGRLGYGPLSSVVTFIKQNFVQHLFNQQAK